MPYFSKEKRYRKNSNIFELQEHRGTVGELFTKIRDKKQFQALVGYIFFTKSKYVCKLAKKYA